MKRFSFWAVFGLLLMTAIGCMKLDDGLDNDPNANTPTLTVSIGNLTKVAFEEDAATSGVKLTWEVGV